MRWYQEPFYAIKCNTDRGVLKTLLPLASGFDCASMGEIATMLQVRRSGGGARQPWCRCLIVAQSRHADAAGGGCWHGSWA